MYTNTDLHVLLIVTETIDQITCTQSVNVLNDGNNYFFQALVTLSMDPKWNILCKERDCRAYAKEECNKFTFTSQVEQHIELFF